MKKLINQSCEALEEFSENELEQYAQSLNLKDLYCSDCKLMHITREVQGFCCKYCGKVLLK